MVTKDFNLWKNIDEFDPAQFADKSSELQFCCGAYAAVLQESRSLLQS